MQSSPVSKVQRSISTSRHDSGSQPSLFGPWLRMVTPRTVTFEHRTGLISHIGELMIVTPSTRTLRQRYGWMKLGRKSPRSPNMRSRHGNPRAPTSRRAARRALDADPAVAFHGHQCSASAWPSSVPVPVIAMSDCSNA